MTSWAYKFPLVSSPFLPSLCCGLRRQAAPIPHRRPAVPRRASTVPMPSGDPAASFRTPYLPRILARLLISLLIQILQQTKPEIEFRRSRAPAHPPATPRPRHRKKSETPTKFSSSLIPSASRPHSPCHRGQWEHPLRRPPVHQRQNSSPPVSPLTPFSFARSILIQRHI
jgi:hypothetical protein